MRTENERRARGRGIPPPRPPVASQGVRRPRGASRGPRGEPGGDGATVTARFRARPGEPPEHLFRRLLAAYLGGASRYEVTERPCLSPATRDVVASFVVRTRGPELVSEGPDLLRLEETSHPGAGLLWERIGELGDRVVALHRGAVAEWNGSPVEDEVRWERRDDRIDREAWFLERALVRSRLGSCGRPDAMGAWSVVHALERIADLAVALGKAGPRLAELGPADPRFVALSQLHAQAVDHLESALGALRAPGANEVLDVGEALACGARAIGEWLLSVTSAQQAPLPSAAAADRALVAIGDMVSLTQEIAQAGLDHAWRASPGAPPGTGRRPREVRVPARSEAFLPWRAPREGPARILAATRDPPAPVSARGRAPWPR